MQENKIPKIIHYCWFGKKEKPQEVLKLINDRKKKLPDYEIKEWNETNFNIDNFKFAKEAYDCHRFAFVADVARIWVLYTFGGIYLDTDVEIISDFDKYLGENAFVSSESTKSVCTAVIGTKRDNPLFKKILNYYENNSFIVNGKENILPNSLIIKTLLEIDDIDLNKKYSLDFITIYPMHVFCSKDIYTYKIDKREDTVSIHHASATWYSKKKKTLKKIKSILTKCGLGFLFRRK